MVYGYSIEIDELPTKVCDKIPTSRQWPIKADPSRPETISYLRNRGFSISAAEKWKGSIEDGIAHLKSFVKIHIHPEGCKQFIPETYLYRYKVDRMTKEVLPVIIDKHNHGWDSLRYALDKYIRRRGGLGVWAKLGQA
jgi:phage terminase large subunit